MSLSLAKFTTIHNSVRVCVCQNRAFWRNCGIKGHGDVPFPSLKPRKFTTITPDSGYLLNRLQKPNNFQASRRKRQTNKQTNKHCYDKYKEESELLSNLWKPKKNTLIYLNHLGCCRQAPLVKIDQFYILTSNVTMYIMTS